jgi:linoleoyl-CoA desaturase
LNKYEQTTTDIQCAVSAAAAPAATTKYSTDFSNYRQIVKRVKTIYPTNESIKSNSVWLLNTVVLLHVGVFFFYASFLSQDIDFIYKCISTVVYATIETSIAFNMLHDSSHYGISKYPAVNMNLSKIVNSWLLWNSNAWFYHHIYYHHSFTGLEEDPDNYKNIVSKHPSTFISRMDLINIMYVFLPGQHLGQSIFYLLIPIFGKYHKPLPNMEYYDVYDIAIILTKLYFVFSSGIYRTCLYFFVLNFLYYINVYPNHSTFENRIENCYTENDWAKMQISNSSNFLMKNMWWTRFFGGINYQIEHHLFPNMSNIHYPAVSQIVEEYCKENNIPYVKKDSLYDAYSSFYKYIEY